MEKNNSLLCVGLDSDYEKLPSKFKKEKNPQFNFNRWIIEQTADLVCAYKPNSAFYEARGDQGVRELKMTCNYLRKKHPEMVIILDAKRGDIETSNQGYVKFVFDYLGVDAVTLHPYLGREALKPFLKRKDKGCIILCRTSNPGAKELQDLLIKGKPLYKIIAWKVISEWNTNHNCLLVVGATYPEELCKIRKIAGEMTFLIPGIGVQGGEIEETVKAGQNSQRKGMIINSSRGVIFSKRPRQEAKKLREQINKILTVKVLDKATLRGYT